MSAQKTITVSKSQAKRLWLRAQRLDETTPFGDGPQAVPAAVEHLGYVQIDTIHVIERCHHHILFTRIPGYARKHLQQAQSEDKTVFEYWAHALAYLPTKDMHFYTERMKQHWQKRNTDLTTVKKEELRKVLALLRKQGALTIRDIDDDVLVEKDHAWASRKPSKRALQLAFYSGIATVSERSGMLKTYELASRHFGWTKPPKPASERDTLAYLLDRALRSQAIVSLDSICYMDAKRKAPMRRLIERRVRAGELVSVAIEGTGKVEHWARPEALDTLSDASPNLVHILSPFDPLVIQRKRLNFFFGYEHRFEAYVPKAKRKYGYFALPVLVDDEIVAAVDLKTDRENHKLLVQQWNWVGAKIHKKRIEEALHRFERFQLER